jgi:hypothetical protein
VNRFAYHTDMVRAVSDQRRKHGVDCLDCDTTEFYLVNYLRAYELALDLNQSRESRELWTARATDWQAHVEAAF